MKISKSTFFIEGTFFNKNNKRKNYVKNHTFKSENIIL